MSSEQSFWLDRRRKQPFPEFEGNEQFDVAIVGGGITGIMTAHFLADKGLKVGLFEASTLLYGTTGRTTGKLTAQHDVIYKQLSDQFGLENAKLYYEANNAAKEWLEKYCADSQIDCHLKTEDSYVFTQKKENVKKLQDEFAVYEKLNIPSEWVKKLPIHLDIEAGIMMKNQAQYHPVLFLQSIIEGMTGKVHIYEHSQVIDVKHEDDYELVFENDSRVQAKHVISASNFPFVDHHGFFARLFPARSYIICVKLKQPFAGGMYINAEEPTYSIRSVQMNGEEYVLVGGMGHKTASVESESDQLKALERFARETFEVEEVLYRWSAQDLETADYLPYIGKVKNEHSFYIATGYKKWGMTTGIIAAQLLSDIILGKTNRYEKLFSPNRAFTFTKMKNLIQENLKIPGELIGGKLTYPNKELHNLKPGEGSPVTIDGKRVGAYKSESDKLILVDPTCTHMGCELNYNGAEKSWDCPCHGSRFSLTGEVLNGPAKKNLRRLNDE